MINITEKLETPEHESILMVNKALKKKGRIKKDIINNLVDVVKYVNDYYSKNKESDEVININNENIEEIISLDRKQIIKYNGIEIKTE